MDIEMINSIDEIPTRKQHTVVRGEYMRVLQALLDSEQPAMVVHCESLDEATKRSVGFYNTVTNKKLAIKVSRVGSDVYLAKMEEGK